jgi:hypothetical protein
MKMAGEGRRSYHEGDNIVSLLNEPFQDDTCTRRGMSMGSLYCYLLLLLTCVEATRVCQTDLGLGHCEVGINWVVGRNSEGE